MSFVKGQKLWMKHGWKPQWQEVTFVRLTAGEVYAVVETGEYGPWGTRHALASELLEENPDAKA